MSHIATADPVPDPDGGNRQVRMSTGDKVRFALRGLGQTLITLGLVVLLFVVYEVWITNLFSERANHRLEAKIEKQWDKDTVDPLLPLPGGKSPTIKLGTGIGNIYIPRLGRDYHFAIVQGTSQDDLAIGPGHYPSTALPGAVGNFAVAGHRVGKGEPFLNVDKLRAGDAVVVETRSKWYVYRVKGSENGLTEKDADGVPGREIVQPSQSSVLLPVPNQQGKQPTERLMTMTTCHPKFTAAKRMIIYSKLQTAVARSGNAMPAQIAALYDEVKS
jgi:sortase A